MHFEVSDFRVLHWTPRILIVRYTKGTFRVLFVVCHAPTAAHPTRGEWWKAFADLLALTIQGDKVVILGDLNSRLTFSVQGRIGDFIWEEDHAPPDPFFRVLQLGDLWVPSTYQSCHTGLGHTWVAPGGSATSRIDYILLPTSWWVPTGGSQVLYQVDFGQTGFDHFAAQVSVDVLCSERLCFPTRAKGFDVAKACQPESARVVQALCENVPRVDWRVNAHQHYHVVSQHLYNGLVHHFPVGRTTRRRPFFSDTTWSLRQQRLWLRRRVHGASAQLRSWELGCAFWTWVSSSESLRHHCCAGLAELLRAIAQLRSAAGELRKIKPAFRKALRNDQQQYIRDVARTAAVSTTKDVVRRLRPLLGPPRRKQRGLSPLPALVTENGEYAATPEDADARWLRHFSAAEHGGPITSANMIERCFHRQKEADLETFAVSVRDIPTLGELESALRASKPGRAAGNDGIPPDILHTYSGQLSEKLYPILLKIAFRLQEPLQFKGGTMRHIWKCKGPQEHCSSYRGILVSNVVGKSFHGAFRKKCGVWYDSAATPLQVGGRRGFPVQLASQAARAYQAGHLRRGNSVAVIFLDLREAFHKVVRPLVHGGDLSDEHIADVMRSLALDPSHFAELRSYLCEDSRLQSAGASPWTAAVIKEFQTDSWLTVGGGLAVAESGTRPRDSLADIVFSFLFSAVPRQVRRVLLERGYEVRLPWCAEWFRELGRAHGPSSDTLAPIDVSWMDDLALLISANSAPELLSAVSGAAAALLDECLRAMLHPNLDPGKTEALVSLTGKQSRTLRSQLFRSAESSIPAPSMLWPNARIRIVPTYKHLGGLLHWSGSLHPELRTRCAQAWQAFRKQRKLVYGSPTVSHRDKALIFLSLVTTRLLYGVGTWDVTEDAYVEKLQGVLVAMTRQMLRPTYSRDSSLHLGAGKILSVARIPSAQVLVHLERLRHVAIVARVAPSEFWAILHHEGRWLDLATDSLRWLASCLELGGCPQVCLREWHDTLPVLLASPQTWKRWLRTAQRVALLRELWEAETRHYHGLLFKFLVKHGACCDADVVDTDTSEVCAICQQRFPDLRSWSHHAFKRHRRVKEARRYAVGSQCQICLKQFPSTFHLSNHLEYSSTCLAELVTGGHQVDVAPGRGSRRFQDGRDVMLPAVRADGPLCQRNNAEFVPEARRPVEGILERLETLYASEHAFESYVDLLEAVRQAFLGFCAQRSRLRATVRAWNVAVHDVLDGLEDASVLWAVWHGRIAAFLSEVDFVDWLVPDNTSEGVVASTFRDGSVLLPWLSLQAVHLPTYQAGVASSLILVAAQARLHSRRLAKNVKWLGHTLCSQQPARLDFVGWAALGPAGIVGLSLLGLISTLSVTTPVKNYRQIEPRLRRLRLFADLVRGVAFLWTRGVRAFLVAEPVDCHGLAAVRQIAPYTTQADGVAVLSNFPDPLTLFHS